MNSDGTVTCSTDDEVEEKLEALQKLLAKRADDIGPITAQQQRQIALSATQVGNLLKKIEALSPGFTDAFKKRFSSVTK
jgi:CRISPR/Cas system CSM-associated protein Csm2 small subunit